MTFSFRYFAARNSFRFTSAVGLSIAIVNIACASSYKIVAEIARDHQEDGVVGGLAEDSSGNLFGESSSGDGTIFELTVDSGYSRVRTVYDFGIQPSGPVGSVPEGGVTLTGKNVILGTNNAGGAYDDGTVFYLGRADALAPSSLHDFHGAQIAPTDGQFETSGVELGFADHYYGTSPFGGAGAMSNNPTSGAGVLYQVRADPADTKYKVIHRFGGTGDGFTPTTARLAIDAQGRMFGVTITGGTKNLGAVYMMQDVGGVWKEQVIHNFGVNDNLRYPAGNVVLDSAGNVYGCAPGGAHKGQGAIFALSPPSGGSGSWSETVLYNFGDQRYDPEIINSPVPGGIGAGCYLSLDEKTNLIVGTTPQGGFHDQGTLFALTPPASGQAKWTLAVGYSFSRTRLGVSQPLSPPLQVGQTYYGGGSIGSGIYAFTP